MTHWADHHRHEPAEWVAPVVFARRTTDLPGASSRVPKQRKVSARCEVQVLDTTRRRPAIGSWPPAPVFVRELVSERAQSRLCRFERLDYRGELFLHSCLREQSSSPKTVVAAGRNPP